MANKFLKVLLVTANSCNRVPYTLEELQINDSFHGLLVSGFNIR